MSPEDGLRWLLEWLFRAGEAGSGSLLSVWYWNRTTPWTAGQSQCGGGPVRAGLARGFAVWQLPARSREMACLAVGVFLQVVLILVLSLPERAGGLDLGDNLAGPQAGRIDIGDRVLGDPLLLVTGVEDRGAVVSADVVRLAVDGRRIVDLEEE